MRRVRPEQTGTRWRGALFAVGALLVIGGPILLAIQNQEQRAAAVAAKTASGSHAPGAISPEYTAYDFGRVRMGGGLLAARFPLAVEDTALVTTLGTTWMCTRARLVQEARATQWQGMPMANSPVPAVNFRLDPEEPAYLEVTIDPAAHGEAGLGPILRQAVLQTAAGQALQFDLTALVTQ